MSTPCPDNLAVFLGFRSSDGFTRVWYTCCFTLICSSFSARCHVRITDYLDIFGFWVLSVRVLSTCSVRKPKCVRVTYYYVQRTYSSHVSESFLSTIINTVTEKRTARSATQTSDLVEAWHVVSTKSSSAMIIWCIIHSYIDAVRSTRQLTENPFSQSTESTGVHTLETISDGDWYDRIEIG